MGKDVLDDFFEETDARPPRRLQVGDTTWTSIIRVSKKDKLICVNPTDYGSDIHILPENYPQKIAGKEVFIDGGPLNKNLKSIPIYVKVERVDAGGYFSKVVETEAWPEPTKKDDDSLFKTERKQSIDWDGSPQKSGSSGTDKRQELLSEDDIRGSKNDLIK